MAEHQDSFVVRRSREMEKGEVTKLAEMSGSPKVGPKQSEAPKRIANSVRGNSQPSIILCLSLRAMRAVPVCDGPESM